MRKFETKMGHSEIGEIVKSLESIDLEKKYGDRRGTPPPPSPPLYLPLRYWIPFQVFSLQIHFSIRKRTFRFTSSNFECLRFCLV